MGFHPDLWRAVLEILILTVGIYYCFRFMRGTRGAPVVTGFLVFLLTFVLVSFLLKLKVLQYLLGRSRLISSWLCW